MPNPFGITQVDIPGIYGAVQTARANRLQQLLGERQLQAADRQAERDNAYNTALTRLFGSPSGAGAGSGASGSPTPTPPPNPVVEAYGGTPPGPAQPAVTPPGLPGANPAGTPAPQQIRIDPAAAQALIQADPARGMQTVQAIQAMNAHQLEQAHARLVALAPLYVAVAHIPYGTDGAQRRAYIQSILPQIQQMGIDPNEAAGFDPTDQNLNAHMALGQTMDQALTSARGHLMNVTQGGSVVDTDNIDPITGQARVVYESPTVAGPGGEVYTRPPAMSQRQPAPPQPGEVRQTSRGPMRFRGGDYRDPANYEPVQPSATPDLDNWNAAGGAPQPNAAGTFP